MSAREWLDAVEASTRHLADAAFDYRALAEDRGALVGAIEARERAIASVVSAGADVPALVAALRAVLDLCESDSSTLTFDGLPVVVTRDYAGEWVRWSDVKPMFRDAIDAHLGGAS